MNEGKPFRVTSVFDTVQGEGARAGHRAVFVRFAGCNLWNGRPEGREKGAGSCAAWCDTDFATGRAYALPDLLAEMDKVTVALGPFAPSARACVLTGGEPGLQVTEALVEALRAAGWHVAVETNGSVANPALALVDHLAIAPKLSRDPRPEPIGFAGGLVGMLMERFRMFQPVPRTVELKVVTAAPGPDGWTAAWAKAFGDVYPWDHRWLHPVDPITAALPGRTYLGDTARHLPVSDRMAAPVRYSAAVAHALRMLADLGPPWRMGVQAHKLWGLA